MKLSIEEIAKVCHQVNKSYCESHYDFSQSDWNNAPDWHKKSLINGVKFHIEHPDVLPSISHEQWLIEKEQEGWKYGIIKNIDKKEHPCFIPFDQLSNEQKSKDFIFKSIVNSLSQI